jgi:hypothetical protein
LTGWTLQEAAGKRMAEVFHVLGANSGEPIQDPTKTAVKRNRTVHIPSNSILLRRDGWKSQSKIPSPPSTTAKVKPPEQSSSSTT